MTDDRLPQIAMMHYDNGMSQQEIARKLGYSKMTISRMLQRAKDQGIVQITVRLPFQLNETQSEGLCKRYQLNKAIVVNDPTRESENLPQLLGRVWAFYMGTTCLDNTILGMGVGNTLAHIVENLTPLKTKNLHIVQLMGGLSDVSSENPITIIQETCRKLNANGTYVTSSAAVENTLLRDSLLYHTLMGQRVMEWWNQCKIALFGIGAIDRGTLLSPDLVSRPELDTLKRSGAIGDILGHCVDRDGNFITTELEERLVSIPISLLRAIDERIAVAGGDYKVKAIRAVLLSGIVTTLVTDNHTATMLLDV